MSPERFRQIDELISQVLEHEERDRGAFLEEACAGDDELRREVESLLASDEECGEFLGKSAAELVAPTLAETFEVGPKGAATPAAPPRAVGRYLVEGELGRGGMGSVYAAWDPELGRRVAIKLIRPEHSGGTGPIQSRARLLREAQALAQVTHPNVIAIHDVGTFEARVFIAMECVEGSTLSDWLAAERRTCSEIVSMFVQAGRGLAAAHAQGIVHRDFKPDNVWIGKDGRARVLDFGLARATWTGSPTGPPRSEEPHGDERKASPRGAMLGTRLTEPEKLLGTPAYMAPEQLSRGPVDARADQFSFCVALHEALHGERPFAGDGVSDILAAIVQGRISEGPNTRRVPAWLRRVLRRGMSPDPSDRFESMDRLLEELDHRPVVTRRRNLMASALALLAAALLFGRADPGRDRLSAGPIRSLMVLPLDALAEGAGRGPDYLAEEITDALTTSLAKIKALHVISRTSAMRYKERNVPLSRISRELNVDAVLEGSVARQGERVRVSLHLIDARTDGHVWAETYERDLRDVVALQREVVGAIAAQIGVQLSQGEQIAHASARQVNPLAYEAYARGRFFWNKRTEDGLHKALAYFNEAIDRDPGYALAYAGVADTYNLLALYELLPSGEAFPEAKRAAMRALELDGGVAEAHTSLARYYENYDRNWRAAESEYRRAIELNPGYATGHDWYATFLSAQGRHEEALAESNKAYELDPFSLTINTGVGFILAEAGREDLAIERLRRTVEMDPNFSYVHFQLGRTYLRKAFFAEAIAELEIAAALSPTMSRYVSALAHAYARAGRKAEALRVLEELARGDQATKPSWSDFAIIHSGLGQIDEAFADLERAVEHREWRLVRMKVEPLFDPLRADPRFADLLRRVGLPP